MHVALTNEARHNPQPVNSDLDRDLLCCLHALGCAFAISHVADDDLDQMIHAIEERRESLELASAQRLLGALKRLDWRVFMEEVADMHGEQSRDWYRKMTLRIIEGLAESVKAKQDLVLRFIDWEATATEAFLPAPVPNE